MNFDTILQELESLGTAQNRKVIRKHGVGENFYGVSFADLHKLQKKIKQDHSLAMQLWATGNQDARMLATMIADPKQADDSLLESWVNDLDNYIITDTFSDFAKKTPLAKEKMDTWMASQEEWIGRAGWRMLTYQAMEHISLPDEYFEGYLAIIERDIHKRKNRVKDAMNSALIAIGVRNSHLEALSMAAAGRIGKVDVDHGETNCKTPDARSYIEKTLRRKGYFLTSVESR